MADVTTVASSERLRGSAMLPRSDSTSNASSAAGPSTSNLSSTMSNNVPEYKTSPSTSRKSRHGKQRAYDAGMTASDYVHSTMTERVFKIRCFERVQVEKSTSALSSILRKASSPKASLSGHKARKSLSGQWNGQDGSPWKGKDRQSMLRGSSNGFSLNTIPPRTSNNVLMSFQWREVTLEAHVDASPRKVCVFEGNRLLHTFNPTDLHCADVYMPSSSVYSAAHPHVLTIRNATTSSPSKQSSSSSPGSIPQSSPASPLRASFASSPPVSPRPGGFRQRSSSFANSLFPSSSSPLAALGLSEGKWPNQESGHKAQPSVSSSGSGDGSPGGSPTPKSKIRRQTSSAGDLRATAGDVVHLAFPTISAVQAWYALLQAFASVAEGGNGRRPTVFAHDKADTSGDGFNTSSTASLSSTSTVSIEAGQPKQHAGCRSWSRAEISSLEALNLRGAMDWHARLFCEIYIDDELRARSYPTTSSNGSVYWSERFSLEQGWHCNACSIIIRMIDRNGLVSDLGTVDIERSRLTRQQTESDRRFEIMPVGGGEVLGDLRLKLRYIELKVERKAESGVWETLSEPSQRSHLNDLTVIPGCSEAICRAGTALNKLDQLLFSLMEEEVIGTPSTLFRSNTPFTRLLDTTMRLYASDFLQRALGNVITDVIDMEVELEIDPTRIKAGKVDERGKELRVWVERLWGDIYMARDRFPGFLRMIFARLTEAVAKAHPDDKKIQQQAVSSFIFLRLIAPAIMWPNLYGLSSHSPPPTTQRSLTSLAKPLLNLSFGIEDKFQDLGGLSALDGWVKQEGDGMRDFLTACSTEIDIPSEPPSSIQSFLSSLPSSRSPVSVLHPTLGPIDLPVELALLEKWGEEVVRVKVPMRGSSSGSSTEVVTVERDEQRDGEGTGLGHVRGEIVGATEDGRGSGDGRTSADSERSFKTAPNMSLPTSPLLKSSHPASPRGVVTRMRMEPRDAHIGRERPVWTADDEELCDGVGGGRGGGSPTKKEKRSSMKSRRRISRESDEFVDLAEAIRSLPEPLPSQVQPWSLASTSRRGTDMGPAIPPRNESRRPGP